MIRDPLVGLGKASAGWHLRHREPEIRKGFGTTTLNSSELDRNLNHTRTIWIARSDLGQDKLNWVAKGPVQLVFASLVRPPNFFIRVYC